MVAAAAFAAFLLKFVKWYLSNDYDRKATIKRGGQIEFFSIEEVASESAEERFLEKHDETDSPEITFDRVFAQTLFEEVLSQLREDCPADRYQRISDHVFDQTSATYEQTAHVLGISEAAVKMGVHRMRKKFGHHLRREIATAVSNPTDIDDERRYLISLLGQ